MDERVAGADCVEVGLRIQRVTDHDGRARRDPRDRFGACQDAHAMAAAEERGDEPLPDIPGAAGNEYVPRDHARMVYHLVGGWWLVVSGWWLVVRTGFGLTSHQPPTTIQI